MDISIDDTQLSPGGQPLDPGVSAEEAADLGSAVEVGKLVENRMVYLFFIIKHGVFMDSER